MNDTPYDLMRRLLNEVKLGLVKMLCEYEKYLPEDTQQKFEQNLMIGESNQSIQEFCQNEDVDIQEVLKIYYGSWRTISERLFVVNRENGYGRSLRSYISLLIQARNEYAHEKQFTFEDVVHYVMISQRLFEWAKDKKLKATFDELYERVFEIRTNATHREPSFDFLSNIQGLSHFISINPTSQPESDTNEELVEVEKPYIPQNKNIRHPSDILYEIVGNLERIDQYRREFFTKIKYNKKYLYEVEDIEFVVEELDALTSLHENTGDLFFELQNTMRNYLGKIVDPYAESDEYVFEDATEDEALIELNPITWQALIENYETELPNLNELWLEKLGDYLDTVHVHEGEYPNTLVIHDNKLHVAYGLRKLKLFVEFKQVIFIFAALGFMSPEMRGRHLGNEMICLPSSDDCEVQLEKNKAILLSAAMEEIEDWLSSNC
ncbi:MAG: hypothetical protein JXA13_10770 [Anaerolineales bacterium]|nr:hypothetical protein [Anaerolineales bacterium]